MRRGHARPRPVPAACPWCGQHFDHPPLPDELLPLADELPDRVTAIPVRPRKKRLPEPGPTPRAERDAAWGLRWAIIVAGLLVVGSCLCCGLMPEFLKEAVGGLGGPKKR